MKGKGSDLVAILGKGLVGVIPFVGPLAAEIVGAVIPNQRMDGLEAFLRKLEEKLEEADQGEVQERFARPEQVDLLEDAFLQASRAMSSEEGVLSVTHQKQASRRRASSSRVQAPFVYPRAAERCAGDYLEVLLSSAMAWGCV